MLEVNDKSFLEGQVSDGDLRQMKKSRLERHIRLKTRYIQELQTILDAERQALAKTRLAMMIKDLKKEISAEIKQVKALAKELEKLTEEKNDKSPS